MQPLPAHRREIRFWLGFVIFGLVASGVTAFPLLFELNLLCGWIVGDGSLDPASHTGLKHWLLYVRQGLEYNHQNYPFIAYGTDWLAFGHLVLALFFIPPMREPFGYRENIRMGMIACIGVWFLAFICGPIRGIPLYWRLIDCSFGVLAIFPLWRVWHLIKPTGNR